jgi:hypothetical protein
LEIQRLVGGGPRSINSTCQSIKNSYSINCVANIAE